MLEEFRIYRKYLCIDLKSFYASVECHERGLDIFKTKLVVADISTGKGAITLAVTPPVKALGVNSRSRLFELPEDKDIIFAKPRMKRYLEVSMNILNVYMQFVDFKDIHVYSIDEVFLDVTNYLSYYKVSARELAKNILTEVLKQTGIYATCGIGPNMLITKLALDIESKHKKDFIAEWDYENLPKKLWIVAPLSKMWGIGNRLEERLNKMGYFTVGDIAKGSIEDLDKEFGFIGSELYFHANGIDQSDLTKLPKSTQKAKSIGQSQVLHKDYYQTSIKVIIKEITDNLCKKLRETNKKTRTISLFIGYKNGEGEFNRQKTIKATSSADVIYKTCLKIFNNNYEYVAIRKVGISLSNLQQEEYSQLSFLKDENTKEKEKKLMKSIDKIKNKYGSTSILRGISYSESGTAVERGDKIGGHNAE